MPDTAPSPPPQSAVDNGSAPETPVKRGRGRPRKHDKPAEPVVKRPRGRPRIHPIPDVPPVKRPRGRPRKSETTGGLAGCTTSTPVKPGAGPLSKSEAATAPEGRQEGVTPVNVDGAPPAKRGPGRPRKSETVTRPHDTPAGVTPTPAAVDGATPIKRGPGRPRKSETAAPPSGSTATAAATPVKRGPGRPRKEPALASVGTAEGVTVTAAAKRGPGRPRKVVVEQNTEASTSSIATASKTPSKTPLKQTTESIDNTPTSIRKSAKRVADSLAAAASTSSGPRKRPRISITNGVETVSTLPSFDEDVFGPSNKSVDVTGGISREAFLANERLRRQREARNFTFEGSASAARKTRSGRVVGEQAEVDEYGANDEGSTRAGDLGSEVESRDEDDDESVRGRIIEVVPDETPRTGVEPLQAGARRHVLGILATLSSSVAVPPPFADEESNEALQGLVSLLKGTVERGEGNSALLTGSRGVGKTRTVERALRLLPSSSTTSPIVVRLSGHAQTDDRKAIREMGRQIAEAEGREAVEEDDADDEMLGGDVAPATLPSHLLALLTCPSPRAIIVILEEFDLFTEHARQALLYCLLDVVQSVQTGPVETTSRGVAVIGVTSRVDTLLLLEKRVKSRFSHRVWRVASPLSPDGQGWHKLLRRSLVPWSGSPPADTDSVATRQWMDDWAFAIDLLLENDKIAQALTRLASLTTDVRLLYRPFISPLTSILSGHLDFLSVPILTSNILHQVELAGWSVSSESAKLRGLPQPAIGVLIIAKHLTQAGRPHFSLAQVEDEYLRFARTRLVGSGRTRWPLELLRRAFDQLKTLGLLAPAGPTAAGYRFAKVRSALSAREIVNWCKAEGAALGPELASWGRLMGAA